MDLMEAIENLRQTMYNRSRATQIDKFDWAETCDLAIQALEFLDEYEDELGDKLL